MYYDGALTSQKDRTADENTCRSITRKGYSIFYRTRMGYSYYML